MEPAINYGPIIVEPISKVVNKIVLSLSEMDKKSGINVHRCLQKTFRGLNAVTFSALSLRILLNVNHHPVFSL